MNKFALIPFLALSIANAELVGFADHPAPATQQKLAGWIGFGIGGASVASSGAPLLSVRGGVEIGAWRLGAWASTVGSDVVNSSNSNEYLDYDALGVVADPTVYRNGRLAVSLPMQAGAGILNFRAKGDEEFQTAGGAFFVGELGAQCGWNFTDHLRISAGGGYRLTYGIETHGLSDGDFRTPFGELQIVYGAF